MLHKSMRSISILFKYAPWLTALKLLQIGLSAVLTPLSIFFTQQIIDTASGVILFGYPIKKLYLWISLLLFSMFFSSVGGAFFNGILYVSIRRKLNVGMTPDILEKFKKLDYACFEDKDVHDTLERMSSDPADKVFQLFLTVNGVFEYAIGVFGASVIFMQAGWWFAIGFAALLLPMILLDFKAADMMNTMFNNQSQEERKMHYLGELLSSKSSLYELKVFGSSGYIVRKWRDIARQVLDARVKTTMRSQKYFLLSMILFKCWSFFVVLSLLSAVLRGTITIGIFTALIASTGTVLENAEMLSHSLQNLRQRHLLMEHYFRFMSLPEIADGRENTAVESPHIVFDDVTFTYPKTCKRVLNGVSFDIRPGERVALVGENGAGKSTIVKLLCRLYNPDGGRILINGVDIRELDIYTMRRIFSVVFQDFCKYTLSLRENVAFGDISRLNDDESIRAALKMGLADCTADLDTPLGNLEEKGVDISGGQWQRIAIARACLPDSAFVILDEPTASLDPVAESEMYHSFAEVLKNRGCIMISHRLASAHMADKIIVLSDGVVAETGSHDELMAANGIYTKMYKAQSSWYVQAPEGGDVL